MNENGGSDRRFGGGRCETSAAISERYRELTGSAIDFRLSGYWSSALKNGTKTLADFERFVTKSPMYQKNVIAMLREKCEELLESKTAFHPRMIEEIDKFANGTAVTRDIADAYVRNSDFFREKIRADMQRVLSQKKGYTDAEDVEKIAQYLSCPNVREAYVQLFVNDRRYSLQAFVQDVELRRPPELLLKLSDGSPRGKSSVPADSGNDTGTSARKQDVEDEDLGNDDRAEGGKTKPGETADAEVVRRMMARRDQEHGCGQECIDDSVRSARRSQQQPEMLKKSASSLTDCAVTPSVSTPKHTFFSSSASPHHKTGTASGGTFADFRHVFSRTNASILKRTDDVQTHFFEVFGRPMFVHEFLRYLCYHSMAQSADVDAWRCVFLEEKPIVQSLIHVVSQIHYDYTKRKPTQYEITKKYVHLFRDKDVMGKKIVLEDVREKLRRELVASLPYETKMKEAALTTYKTLFGSLNELIEENVDYVFDSIQQHMIAVTDVVRVKEHVRAYNESLTFLVAVLNDKYACVFGRTPDDTETRVHIKDFYEVARKARKRYRRADSKNSTRSSGSYDDRLRNDEQNDGNVDSQLLNEFLLNVEHKLIMGLEYQEVLKTKVKKEYLESVQEPPSPLALYSVMEAILVEMRRKGASQRVDARTVDETIKGAISKHRRHNLVPNYQA